MELAEQLAEQLGERLGEELGEQLAEKSLAADRLSIVELPDFAAC